MHPTDGLSLKRGRQRLGGWATRKRVITSQHEMGKEERIKPQRGGPCCRAEACPRVGSQRSWCPPGRCPPSLPCLLPAPRSFGAPWLAGRSAASGETGSSVAGTPGSSQCRRRRDDAIPPSGAQAHRVPPGCPRRHARLRAEPGWLRRRLGGRGRKKLIV